MATMDVAEVSWIMPSNMLRQKDSKLNLNILMKVLMEPAITKPPVTSKLLHTKTSVDGLEPLVLTLKPQLQLDLFPLELTLRNGLRTQVESMMIVEHHSITVSWPLDTPLIIGS